MSDAVDIITLSTSSSTPTDQSVSTNYNVQYFQFFEHTLSSYNLYLRGKLPVGVK